MKYAHGSLRLCMRSARLSDSPQRRDFMQSSEVRCREHIPHPSAAVFRRFTCKREDRIRTLGWIFDKLAPMLASAVCLKFLVETLLRARFMIGFTRALAPAGTI
eukprot:273929-Pleurochrysis_carterae.AAC.1